MLGFTVQLRPGVPVHEQVFYAVKRAIVSGQLAPGDSFPSVRQLSRELSINPNTAHKVVSALIHEGFLEARPGIGTSVARVPKAGRAERAALLAEPLERIVVEAKRLDLQVEDVMTALHEHWRRLTTQESATGQQHREVGTS